MLGGRGQLAGDRLDRLAQRRRPFQSLVGRGEETDSPDDQIQVCLRYRWTGKTLRPSTAPAS